MAEGGYTCLLATGGRLFCPTITSGGCDSRVFATGGRWFRGAALPKLADDASRMAEPFDRGYWLWKYGRKVSKQTAKVDKPEPKRPNLMPDLVAEDLALSQLEAVQLREAELARDIRDLQAYIEEVTLGIESGLAAQVAAAELEEQRQVELMARLEENLIAARESLLLAMEAQRIRQNQLAAIETVIRYYY